jgi:hypothetical protein
MAGPVLIVTAVRATASMLPVAADGTQEAERKAILDAALERLRARLP